MKPAFRELTPEGAKVAMTVDGRTVEASAGSNLAAALLVAGVTPFRHTPASGAPRGPFCMMGACFDCLVTIDGETRQACMCEVKEGLEITLPKGASNA